MRASFSLFAAALPALVSASGSAQVYLQPAPSSSGQRTPALSPYEANSVLARYTGLSRSIFAEVIEDAVDFGRKEWSHLWNSVHPVENTIGAGRPDVLMIVMQSDYPQDFMTTSPAFTIPDAPAPSHFSELLETYVSKAHAAFDRIAASVLDLIHTPSEPASLPTYKGALDIFDLTPSESIATFKDELDALVSVFEDKWDEERTRFSGLELKGLSDIAKEHGRNSEVYQTAAKTLQAIFSQTKQRQLKLVLVVYPSTQHGLYSRAEAVVAKHPVIPIFSSSQCFTSVDACSNSTDSCSGHGSCLEVSRANKVCFACSCGTTTNSTSKRSTSWAGASCEKQDVSVQFALLAGSTLLIIAIGIASVGILYSIGNVELPNVLTSGSTSHLKRD